MDPHKKFNTHWGTLYSRDLAEFTKEKIMAMCPKNVVDIRVPRRNDWDRLMELPIIELEFEYDILNPHIIIGESMPLRMKKETNFI